MDYARRIGLQPGCGKARHRGEDMVPPGQVSLLVSDQHGLAVA